MIVLSADEIRDTINTSTTVTRMPTIRAGPPMTAPRMAGMSATRNIKKTKRPAPKLATSDSPQAFFMIEHLDDQHRHREIGHDAPGHAKQTGNDLAHFF